MDLEWDESKNSSNILKHGIDFRDAYLLFEQPLIVRPDNRFQYNEERWTALGKIREGFVVVVYTIRGPRLRIISIRRANKHERKIYQEEIKNR